MHKVVIADDFSLAKIARSGQCFRVHEVGAGWWRFIAGDRVLFIRRASDEHSEDNSTQNAQLAQTEQLQQWGFAHPFDAGEFEISTADTEWTDFWHNYFDMERDYCAIRQACEGSSDFVDAAMRFGAGLRVLNQDPWEMLVTFIISQRKSIPAISRAVEEISRRFGAQIHVDVPTKRNVSEGFGAPTECGASKERKERSVPTALDASKDYTASKQHNAANNPVTPKGHGATPLFAFPTPAALAAASEDELKACGLGYRVPYVRSAAIMVESGELDLAALTVLPDEDLFAELQRVHGVGKKVANCVCLFGYGRSQMVPVDVWIERAINEECAGCDPFAQFGPNAGIMQQYVFYYMTNR